MVSRRREHLSPSQVQPMTELPESIEYGQPLHLRFSIIWPDCPFVKRTMEVKISLSHCDGRPVSDNHELPFWFKGNIEGREHESAWRVKRAANGELYFEVNNLVFVPESCGHSWTLGFEIMGKPLRSEEIFQQRLNQLWNSPIRVVARPGESLDMNMQSQTFPDHGEITITERKAHEHIADLEEKLRGREMELAATKKQLTTLDDAVSTTIPACHNRVMNLAEVSENMLAILDALPSAETPDQIDED